MQPDALLSPSNSISGDKNAFSLYRIVTFGVAYTLALIYLSKDLKSFRFAIAKSSVLTLLLVYILFSILWSLFPTKVIINYFHYIGIYLVAISLGLSSSHDLVKFLTKLNLVLLISIVLSIIVSFIFPQITRDIDGRWMGMTGHANTLGMVTVIGVWSSLSLFFLTKTKLKYFYFASLVLALIGLIGSRSVSSWVIGIIILTGLIIMMNARNINGIKSIIYYFVVFWFATVFTTILYLLFPEYFSLDAMLGLVGKNRTLTGRSELWLLADKAISMKPYFGWGFDSLASVLSNETKMLYGQFHNGYLNLMVEGGRIGLVLFFLFVVHYILLFITISTKNQNVFIVWFIIFLSILIHNISEASIVRTPHIYWTILLAGYFSVIFTLTKHETQCSSAA
ncbi:MAG: O-antigen ligase family protein [Candidatus Thiodiazotropha taylori]